MTFFARRRSRSLSWRAVSRLPARRAGAPKFAFVDSQAILLDAAPGRAGGRGAVQQGDGGLRATQVKQMSDSLNAMIADYQKAQATLAARAQETQRRRRFRRSRRSISAARSELEQQMQQRQSELVQPIMEQIRKVLEDIRAEDGYAVHLRRRLRGSADRRGGQEPRHHRAGDLASQACQRRRRRRRRRPSAGWRPARPPA